MRKSPKQQARREGSACTSEQFCYDTRLRQVPHDGFSRIAPQKGALRKTEL